MLIDKKTLQLNLSVLIRRKKLSSEFILQIFLQHDCTVPSVEMVDDHGRVIEEKIYKTGSTIELKCVVSKVPGPTANVMWRHGLRLLNYDTSRGGIRYYHHSLITFYLFFSRNEQHLFKLFHKLNSSFSRIRCSLSLSLSLFSVSEWYSS